MSESYYPKTQPSTVVRLIEELRSLDFMIAQAVGLKFGEMRTNALGRLVGQLKSAQDALLLARDVLYRVQTAHQWAGCLCEQIPPAPCIRCDVDDVVRALDAALPEPKNKGKKS